MALKFSTLNYRGLQDNFKRKLVFNYFHKKGVQIFSLMIQVPVYIENSLDYAFNSDFCKIMVWL